ncbi:unnamed protein product, partial [Prunus brigantina]
MIILIKRANLLPSSKSKALDLKFTLSHHNCQDQKESKELNLLNCIWQSKIQSTRTSLKGMKTKFTYFLV